MFKAQKQSVGLPSLATLHELVLLSSILDRHLDVEMPHAACQYFQATLSHNAPYRNA